MSERVSVFVHEGGSRFQLVILSTEYIYAFLSLHPLFYLILEAVSMVTLMG